MDLSNLRLQELLQMHILTEKLLNETLEQNAILLSKLIPDQINEHMRNPKVGFEELKGIVWASLSGEASIANLQEPKEYGFKNKEEMLGAFELLKKAWEGIIEVNIIEGYPLKRSYKLVLEPQEKGE